MRIIILTSSRRGTASHHLSKLLNVKGIDVAMVVFSQGLIKSKQKFFKQKLKKLFKIGLLGTINGIRLRKWFGVYVEKYIHFEDIEDVCKKNGISFFVTPAINCKETEDLFITAKADIGVSIGNGYIGSKIFTKPRLGMINIHHEILPEYQNAQGIIWQLYNGSRETGFTIHKIDKHIDTGEILYKEKMPIQFRDSLEDTVVYTLSQLYEKSAEGLIRVLENFESYNSNATRQQKGKVYTTPSIWQFIRIRNNYRKLRKGSKQ